MVVQLFGGFSFLIKDLQRQNEVPYPSVNSAMLCDRHLVLRLLSFSYFSALSMLRGRWIAEPALFVFI